MEGLTVLQSAHVLDRWYTFRTDDVEDLLSSLFQDIRVCGKEVDRVG